MAQLKESPKAGDTGDESWGGEDPLVREMVAHSSILAQKNLWTEEPGATVRGAGKRRQDWSD